MTELTLGELKAALLSALDAEAVAQQAIKLHIAELKRRGITWSDLMKLSPEYGIKV